MLSMLLSLAACGGSDTTPAPDAAPAPEAAAAPEAAPADAEPEAEAGTDGAAAADAAHGEQIVGEKCTSCHKDEVYTREDHKVTTADALKTQVDMCGGAAKLEDAEKADVTAYLQSKVYTFE